MSGEIHTSYRLLKSIIKRHESKIQKRWEKKTKAQRLSVLLEAWPGSMPATHRPDFAAFIDCAGVYDPALQAKLRGDFMWPYVNLEDLVKPKPLLLLLNSRARNHPSVFTAADKEAMFFGLHIQALVGGNLDQHVMLLNGMTQDEDYGRLIHWDDHIDAFHWMISRKQFEPGEGLLVLEAQARLMTFLVSCCHRILHDIPSEELVTSIYPIQPEPLPRGANDEHDGVLSSLTAMAVERPYRAPARLDLDRIKSLLAARAASAQDHVWALREDPGYWADHVFEITEHRQEILKDAKGNVHPVLRKGKEEYFWARVVGNVVVRSIFNLDMFEDLHAQAAALHVLQSKYEARGKVSPLHDLPDEFLSALLKFQDFLNQVAKAPLHELKVSFAASPPVRHLFCRAVPQSMSISSEIEIVSKSRTVKNYVNQLLFVLQTLWEDGVELYCLRIYNVIDELDRMFKEQAETRELVSPYIVTLVGELSIVSECLRQLDTYQPWASGFDYASQERGDAIKADFAKRTQSEARIVAAFEEEKLVKADIPSLGEPSKFHYPVGKRRNKTNVDGLRAAEANLDILWGEIDKLVLREVGTELEGTALKRLLSQPRQLQRTPEWVEPTKADRKQGPAPIPAVESIINPLSSIVLGPEAPSVRKEILTSTTKAKVKSRGTPGPQEVFDSNAEASPSSQPPDPQPVFEVDARTLKAFRVIFFDPLANTTPGEVAWNNFLHAMASVGFSAQKLYGSVWHFQPTKLDVERSIQFHEPHPQGKIPLVARRHGRRLNRAYGWFGGMFILRSKQSS